MPAVGIGDVVEVRLETWKSRFPSMREEDPDMLYRYGRVVETVPTTGEPRYVRLDTSLKWWGVEDVLPVPFWKVEHLDNSWEEA